MTNKPQFHLKNSRQHQVIIFTQIGQKCRIMTIERKLNIFFILLFTF